MLTIQLYYYNNQIRRTICTINSSFFFTLETNDIISAIIGTKLDKFSSVIVPVNLCSSSSLFVDVFLTIFSKVSDCSRSLLESFLDAFGILLVRFAALYLSCDSKLQPCRAEKNNKTPKY